MIAVESPRMKPIAWEVRKADGSVVVREQTAAEISKAVAPEDRAGMRLFVVFDDGHEEEALFDRARTVDGLPSVSDVGATFEHNSQAAYDEFCSLVEVIVSGIHAGPGFGGVDSMALVRGMAQALVDSAAAFDEQFPALGILVALRNNMGNMLDRRIAERSKATTQ